MSCLIFYDHTLSGQNALSSIFLKAITLFHETPDCEQQIILNLRSLTTIFI